MIFMTSLKSWQSLLVIINAYFNDIVLDFICQEYVEIFLAYIFIWEINIVNLLAYSWQISCFSIQFWSLGSIDLINVIFYFSIPFNFWIVCGYQLFLKILFEFTGETISSGKFVHIETLWWRFVEEYFVFIVFLYYCLLRYL